MFISTLVAGYVPIVATKITQSAGSIRFLTIFGAGLLVGAVLLVIIPEGVLVILSGQVHAALQKHADNDHVNAE